MERTVRNLTDLTKQKISDSMKTYHQQKGEEEKRTTTEKQSDITKRYWKTIPTVDDYDRQKPI